MANDMKSGIGFIIPAAGVVGFFTSLLMGEFLVSIIIAVAGILVWFLYMLVMESHMPEQMGNMIMLFGIMLAVGIFFGFGVTQNMFGGFEFKPEGSIFSLIILFFAVLTGLNFRNQSSQVAPAGGGLSDVDRDLVMNAINQTKDSDDGTEEPRVIVVKQEAAPAVEKEEEKKEEKQPDPNDPYGMGNPYFAYPPDYYYDEDDEDDEDWDEDDEDDEDE